MLKSVRHVIHQGVDQYTEVFGDKTIFLNLLYRYLAVVVVTLGTIQGM